jgi:serine/threonine protein kinase
MKFIAGRSLAEVLKKGSGMALLPNIIAVAEAMAYAHSRRIVHRDLKPGNILVGDFGETVVIDWGLAKDLDAPRAESPSGLFRVPNPELTQAGAGTPRYMPPEQAEGRSNDPRVDIYALGATLYHVLSGTPPFGKGSTSDVLARVRTCGPEPLAADCPSLPEPLVAIVTKAMAHDPDDRYQTAAELADDLKRVQAGQGMDHRSVALAKVKAKEPVALLVLLVASLPMVWSHPLAAIPFLLVFVSFLAMRMVTASTTR